MPCFTNTKLPGLTRSWTRAAFSGVISSPGLTAASHVPFARNNTEIVETNVTSHFILRSLSRMGELSEQFVYCLATLDQNG